MDRRRFLRVLPLFAAGVRADVPFTGGKPASVTEPTAKAVFTPDEVKSLNAFQRAGVRHQYTCVNGRDRVPGELVWFRAMSHCSTEAEQQFANHTV